MKRTPLRRFVGLKPTSAKFKRKLKKLLDETLAKTFAQVYAEPSRKPMRKSRPKMTPERKAARGMPCLLNVANVCNGDDATTVLAHLRFLGGCGTAFKPDDLQGVHGCSACNTWTDTPTPRQVRACGGRVEYERDRNYYAARGLARMRILDRSKAQ